MENAVTRENNPVLAFSGNNGINFGKGLVLPRPEETDKMKPKRPPTFDGTSNWQDFLVQFEMISAVNKWSEAMKAYELATSLRGVAQGIVTEIDPVRRLDYNYLVMALTARFQPANQANMFKSQMNSYYRKTGQTLPEMGHEIRRITRLAYPTAPTDIRDQLAKDCFIRAINDPKIQLSIFQRDPKTIDDCIRFGLDYEAFVVEQKRYNQKQGLRMQYENDVSDEGDIIGSRLAKMSQQIELMTNTKDDNKKDGTACFYCGMKGHFKRDCRKFARDRRNNFAKITRNSRTNQSTKGTQGTQTDNQGNI